MSNTEASSPPRQGNLTVRTSRCRAIPIIDPRTRSSLETTGNELTFQCCRDAEPEKLVARDSRGQMSVSAASLSTASEPSVLDQGQDFKEA